MEHTIPQSIRNSCADVDEDSDENWVKEPTNVEATFLGNRTTRVTWSDQAGVEGERYHIWRAGYRVQGAEFKVNDLLLDWMGSVPDGVEQFDVILEEGVYHQTHTISLQARRCTIASDVMVQ